MQVTIELPDGIVEHLGEVDGLPRRLVEVVATDAYRREKLSRYQLSQLLHLDYWETDELLDRYDAKRPYTLDDLEVDRQSYVQLDQQ